MSEQKNDPSQDNRLDFQSNFKFRCHPGVKCFTTCCADVTIFLAPYDVLRLKNRLEIKSSEFIDRHTVLISKQGQVIPLFVLKMSENEKKTCPFVTPDGCTVYEDRPWACRMFPLDVDEEEKFSIIAAEDKCFGLLESDDNRVIEWLEDQGVMDYQRVNNYYAEITSNPKLKGMEVANDKVSQMIYMAAYDLDRFREFVLNTRFKDMFEFEDDLMERVRVDDSDLLHLGLDWIKFGLFGEKTLKVKAEVLEAEKRNQEEQKKS